MNERAYIELRSHTYRLFVGLINHPVSDATWNQLILWANQTGDSGFLSPVQQWIIKHEEMPQHGLMSLAVDFTRLFTGVALEYGPPPPYEHLYREDTEPSTCRAAVIQCYHNSKAKPLDPYSNMSDHIVSELQYMSFLAAQQGKLDDLLSDENSALISQQQLFLQHHLLSWVHSWCNRVGRQKNNVNFYSHLIGALVCFLEQDFKYLSCDITFEE